MEQVQAHLYKILVVLVASIIGGGTIFYHFTEKWSWLDAYYFCVVTLATVGYGDLTPHTRVGKFVTTFYILAGVGIVTTFITFTMKRRGTIYKDKHPKPQESSSPKTDLKQD